MRRRPDTQNPAFLVDHARDGGDILGAGCREQIVECVGAVVPRQPVRRRLDLYAVLRAAAEVCGKWNKRRIEFGVDDPRSWVPGRQGTARLERPDRRYVAEVIVLTQALVRQKYRRLFSSKPSPKKRGPRGPDEPLIRAIVELKQRNPRFGCPRRR